MVETLELERQRVSPKISRAKALVRFSRYRAAQEAAPGRKLDLNRLKQRVGLLPRFVSDMGSPWANAFAVSPDPAAAGSALRAHFSRGREKCGLASALAFQRFYRRTKSQRNLNQR